MTGRRRTAVWVGAALAGLVLAAGLTSAAAQLSNQSVGLSSEPLTAGDELVPAPTSTRTATPRATRTASRTATPRATRTASRTATPAASRTAAPAPPRTAVPTVDDHGGDDSGGRGRGGGDD